MLTSFRGTRALDAMAKGVLCVATGETFVTGAGPVTYVRQANIQLSEWMCLFATVSLDSLEPTL